MKNTLRVNNVIKPFNRKISVEGDKSLSIRWVLLASLSKKKSIAYNLLKSEDVLSALKCIKKLGSKVKLKKNSCEIFGTGLSYNFKEKLILDAGNSGTLARLILGLLINTKKEVTLIGDRSLSKRDFSRVTSPLKKFGMTFKSKNGKLPLTIFGSKKPASIDYFENRGSAQCKTAVMFAGLKSSGITNIKAKKSRNHTELLFKYLKIPIKIRSTRKYDFIKLKRINYINPLNYKIPGDISSCAFFIVLTILAKNSQLFIKNININPSRTGLITILKKMGANIKLLNIKKYKGEKIADIFVKSSNNLKGINCSSALNSSAIDEFLVIFLVAAKSKGVSIFKNLAELNEKESPRLQWGSKILTELGIKNISNKNSIKIYGNPKISITKKIKVNNFLKDHRVFMMSVIAALTFGGKWEISDLDSIKTSFPSFLKILKSVMH